MSDSVRPHRRQPTRLPRPWDSPGKNAGVGCHFLLQRIKVKSQSEVAQSCPTLSDPMDCSLPGSSVHGIFRARVLEWGAIAFSYNKTRRRLLLGGSYYYYPHFTDKETETDKIKSFAQGHVVNKGQKRNCEYRISGSWDNVEHFEHTVSHWTFSYSFLCMNGPLSHHSHTVTAKQRFRLARGTHPPHI